MTVSWSHKALIYDRIIWPLYSIITFVCPVLFGLGDVIAQRISRQEGEEFDWPRLRRACVYGSIIFAPLAHIHFNFLEWLVVKKVSDNTVSAPKYICISCVILGTYVCVRMRRPCWLALEALVLGLIIQRQVLYMQRMNILKRDCSPWIVKVSRHLTLTLSLSLSFFEHLNIPCAYTQLGTDTRY